LYASFNFYSTSASFVLFAEMHYETNSNAERARLASLLRESLLTLCRNGIAAGPCVVRVDGLIGVTLQDQHVVLVSIHEALSIVSDEDSVASNQLGEKTNDIVIPKASVVVGAAADSNVMQTQLPQDQFGFSRMREQRFKDLESSHSVRAVGSVGNTDLVRPHQVTGSSGRVYSYDDRMEQEMGLQHSSKLLTDVRKTADVPYAANDEVSDGALRNTSENIMMPMNEVFASSVKVSRQ
jgi:hypothetical protein